MPSKITALTVRLALNVETNVTRLPTGFKKRITPKSSVFAATMGGAPGGLTTAA